LTLRSWQAIPLEKAHHLDSLILRITDHAKSGSETAAYCCQFSLAGLLDALVWSCVEFPRSVTGTDGRLVGVRQFIERHYADPITVEELAGLAGMSRGYLFRAFKGAFGRPPLTYQQHLRLEAAKTLLRSTSLRSQEIASRCGYENSQFFCGYSSAAPD